MSRRVFDLENAWLRGAIADEHLRGVLQGFRANRRSSEALKLINNEELLKGLSIEVGRVVAAEGLGEDVERDVDGGRKVSRLGYYRGYYGEVVKKRPMVGVKGFLKAGTKEGDLKLMAEVIAELRKGAPWEEIDTIFPRDGRHVAVACRKALYERWGEFEPAGLMRQLVEYKEYGEPMVKALLALREQDAGAADGWVREVVDSGRDNPAWDAAQLYYLELLVREKRFEEAFARVYEMKKERNHGVSATQTHAKWMKVDYKAAEAARKEYMKRFPGKKK